MAFRFELDVTDAAASAAGGASAPARLAATDDPGGPGREQLGAAASGRRAPGRLGAAGAGGWGPQPRARPQAS